MPSSEDRPDAQPDRLRALMGFLRPESPLPQGQEPSEPQEPSGAPAAVPTTPDPEGAIEDMRLAHSYLQDWENKATDDVLSHAAKYLELARTKDPTAKLTVEAKVDGKIEALTYSIDDLAGRTLFYRAQTQYDPNDRKTLERARDTLKKAIEYAPYSIQFRAKLADVFLDLHDKESALAVAKEAASVNPKNLDARKLLDRIEAAPTTHAPTVWERNPGCAGLIIALALFILGVISFANDVVALGWMLMALALIAWGAGRLLENQKTFEKAIDHTRDEAQRKRMRR